MQWENYLWFLTNKRSYLGFFDWGMAEGHMNHFLLKHNFTIFYKTKVKTHI